MDINILGFGVMGRQIASLCILMGIDVFLWNRSNQSSSHRLFEKQLKLDRRFYGKYIENEGVFTFVSDLSHLNDRLTLEVLIEDIDIKKKVIAGLDFGFEKNLLVTNSSSYSPGEIHPDAIGIHFFNPVCALKFIEFSAADAHLKEQVKDFLELLIKFEFDIVKTSDNRGYIGNFLLFNEIANALKLIDKFGYNSRAIDTVLNHMGRSVSIFDIIDRVGVDVTKKILENLREADNTIEVSPLLSSAIAKNIYGKKNNTSIREIID